MGFYLRCKLGRRREDFDRVIPVVDIYSVDPWILPSRSGELCFGDGQWFFFSPRQEREAYGGRPNRITPSGYWKATGTAGYVFSSDNCVIGVKRTMVFYRGKAPTGEKTKWKVNEYKAFEEAGPSNSTAKLRPEFSLCRVYETLGSMLSFDRRPLIAETGTAIAGVGNDEGGNGRNSYKFSCKNPSIEEQVNYAGSSSPWDSVYGPPTEQSSNCLNTVHDLDVLWTWG